MSLEEKSEFKIFSNSDYQAVPTNDSNSSSNCLNELPACTKLPYDLTKLNWDSNHLTNEEDTYCYCGRNLDFYRSLLQCFTCKQWFHLMCIKSLDYDLLIGDQYFKFVCSVCNGGNEIIQRITMKWKVAVGLTLSNLTYGSDMRFFNIHQDIIPYLKENEDKVSCQQIHAF